MDLSYRPQTQSPSPTPSTCSNDADQGPDDELLALQELGGCGNAYAQDLMRQGATGDEGASGMAEVESAAAEVDTAIQSETAPGEAVTAELNAGIEATAEVQEAPPTETTPEPTTTAPPATDAPAVESAPEGAPSAAAAATEEFKNVYRTTSAEETDAWLATLAERGASDPELAALAADLRTWVDQKRAERVARERMGTCPTEEEPAPPEQPAEVEEEVCEQPAEEESGFWQQIGEAISNAWAGVVAWWEGENPEEAEQLAETCPTREDIRLEIPHYEQNTWYGADGAALDAETAQSNQAILSGHGIYGAYNPRADAYNDYLRLPVAERGDTITYYDGGEQKTERVPDDVLGMDPVKFIPGGASCLRTAKAMAAEGGAAPLSGSGVQDSHFQTLFTSDEDAMVDANGAPITFNRGRNAGREVKTNGELGEQRADQITQATGLSAAYIDAELEAGRPVVVGASYTDRNGNRDQTTDHWMTIYGRQGDTYLYYDPAFDGGAGEGAFQADPSQGGVMEGQNSGRTYAMANVALNNQSADQASAVDDQQTWREVAKASNDEFAEGTPENKRLGW